MRKSVAAFFVAAVATLPPVTALAAPITMAWSPVGNPGNAADPATGSLYGAVGYSYNIGTYDVTVSQYVAFINSNDPTGADPLGLYNSNLNFAITYNSAASGDKYSVVSGDGNHPITDVTFYETLRFANWLGNGQTPGSTETGAYTLLGGTPTPSNGATVTRNADATVFLPSENEWYKAAYYNPATSSYYLYATSSNTAPTASVPTATHDSANYNSVVGNLTNVGAYSGTTSPYGAYDMNGDVFQWNEALISGSYRGLRGGSVGYDSSYLLSSYRHYAVPTGEAGIFGFRVASVLTPEPSTGVLALVACGVILWWRKRFK
jgi:formylglycine-generating enzyme required for sulfatase activity